MELERITSRQNPLVARLRKLGNDKKTRRQEGVFLCEGHKLVEEALRRAGRTDLIGYDKKCLIRPRGGKNEIQKGGSPKTGKPQVVSRPKASRPKKTIRNVHKKKG